MKPIAIVILLALIIKATLAQGQFKVTFHHLKEFEGLYQYVNNTTLKIAASPKDTILFAIIADAKYPLRPFRKDGFLNNANQEVIFQRNKLGNIIGYTVEGDTFKMLDKNLSFPKAMWYARIVPTPSAFVYQYKEPLKRKDGIETGHMSQTALNASLLSEMMGKVVDGTYPNVHSVLIIKDEKLVFEEYFYEYNETSLHPLRSASKSFISALIGLAIEKGIIKDQYQSVLSYFPEYAVEHNSASKSKITIENLLTNQSGFDCDISNDKSAGNETAMNYSDDWAKFTLDLPMIDTAGGKGMYCSGNPIILGRIIEKASGTNLFVFAKENLFTPMEIKNFQWNFKPDKSNAEDFYQLYLRPRDMAKFGLLYLNGGTCNGKQIISSNWIKQSLTKQSVIQNVNYGYLWWLKYLDADGVRYQGMVAQGNGGQRIYIWPEQNMVIVITAGSYNTQSASDELVSKFILAAFNSKR